MAKIVGVNNKDAGFSVKFPDGFEGEPVIHFEGLAFDGEGTTMSSVSVALLAAAKWLEDHELTVRTQPAVVNSPVFFGVGGEL